MRIHHVLATALVATTVALLPSPAKPAPASSADGETSGRTTVGIRTASKGNADNRGKYVYEILPKQSRQDAVAVYNYSLRPVTVRLLARDAVTTPAGEFSAQPSSEQPRGIGAWIALDKKVVHLEPRSMSVVPFQVGVPFNATPGDHAGSILVSLLAKEPKQGAKEDIVVEHRVGLRVYLRVPGTLEPELRVEGLKVTYAGSWKSLGLGRPEVDYTIRNTGNVRLSAKQQVEMLRSFGLPSTSAKPKALGELLPGGFVRVHQRFPRTWAVGDVTAKVTLSPAGLDKSVQNVPEEIEERSVFVFPWLLALIVALLLLGAGGGSWRRRRHRERALDSAPLPTTDPQPVLTGRAPGSHRLTRGVLGACAVLASIGLGLAAPAHAADDVPVWKATVLPAKGGADDPIELRTSGGCPRPADSILGRVYGKGFAKGGTNVIGNTKAGVTPEGPFSAPIAFSMKEFMSQQPTQTALAGTYRFVVTCRTAKYAKSYGDYVAEIRFTDPGHWVAAKPVTNATGPVLHLDENGDPIEKPGAAGSGAPGGSGSASPSEGAPSGPAENSPQASGAPTLTAASEEPDGNSSLAYGLIVVGVAVACATGFLVWRRRA